MKENPQQQPCSGNTAEPAVDSTSESVIAPAAPPVPAGVPGAQPNAEVTAGADAYPDGPNVEASPWELDAARGKLPDPPG